MSNEVIAKESHQLAQLPVGAGMSYDGEDATDLVLPHLLLMQGLSKLVAQAGKRLGTFVNSMTLKDYAAVEFVPVVYMKYFDGLKPVGNKMEFEFRTYDKADARLKGRRFFADRETKAKANVNTTMAFIALVDGMPVIIPFNKKSYAAGKKLYTMWKFSNLPLFATKYKLLAKSETNDQGTFFVKDLEVVGPASDQDLLRAHEIYKSYASKVTEASDLSSTVEVEEVPF